MASKQEVGTAIEKKEDKKEIIQVQLSPGEFELEAYINNYAGHTKIARLLFVAEHCKSLEADSLKLSIELLKKTTNTLLYKNVTEKVGMTLGSSYAIDQSWIDGTEKKAIQQQEKLEADLNQFRTNLIKESIRVAQNELGDFFYHRGDLNAALKCYVRSRDYCTNSKHILQMCMNVIKVSIEMGNYAHVSNYVAKAEQTPDLTDKVVIAKLKVCSGLANLSGKKYKQAAKKFLETTFDLGTNFNEVVSPQDVAVYGALCSLATFERSELKKVIDSSTFRSFLELVPEVRELLSDFYFSRYASCLKHLDKLKNSMLLDIHLHEHVESLLQKIREKALVQYFSPFTSVDMQEMAKAFNTTVVGLEKELSKLIFEGLIQARIDSHNMRLLARQTDQRSTTFEKTIHTGEEFQEHTKALILRMSLMKNDFIVKPRRGDDNKDSKKI